jgi:hypothetical protein
MTGFAETVGSDIMTALERRNETLGGDATPASMKNESSFFKYVENKQSPFAKTIYLSDDFFDRSSATPSRRYVLSDTRVTG